MEEMTIPFRQDGRVAMVTGGASGIGEAFVRAFAKQGCNVGFLDIDVDAGSRLASELTAL